MADFAALKALIDTEPLNAARTDQEVLDWLNESVTVQTDIDYNTWMVWASEEGIARKIKAAIADEETTPGTWTAPVYNDVLTVNALIQSGGDISLSRDDVRTIVATISGAGLPLTPANKNALLAKSDELQPRWQADGQTKPSLQVVNIARGFV